ncbi:hypothetical protein [Vibrio phage vB_ValP_IME271]|nr:hypothetical protein [Vibrio phage vB_ValP_IME271]
MFDISDGVWARVQAHWNKYKNDLYVRTELIKKVIELDIRVKDLEKKLNETKQTVDAGSAKG